MLRQLNPVLSSMSYLFKIMCFNNILLSKPGLRKCSFTFLFSDQNLLCISAMHAASPPPSHNSWFDLLNTIWWTLKIMAIFIVKLHLLLPLKSKYSSQQFVLKHPLRFTIWSLALLRYAKFHTIKKQDWKDVLFEYTDIHSHSSCHTIYIAIAIMSCGGFIVASSIILALTWCQTIVVHPFLSTSHLAVVAEVCSLLPLLHNIWCSQI